MNYEIMVVSKYKMCVDKYKIHSCANKKKPLYLFLLLDLIVRDLLKILQKKILIKKKKTEKDHSPPFQTTRQSFECGTASISAP